MTNPGDPPNPPSVVAENTNAKDADSGRDIGRYAYSPLGDTGLMRAGLPSKVTGSYEGFTYAAAADLTIYGGDLTITIDWSDAAAEDTRIEVMISDLTDSDGMGWADTDGDSTTKDPILASITFEKQGASKLVSFETDEADETNILNTLDEMLAPSMNVAGFNKVYGDLDEDVNDMMDEVVKLVYDDDSVVYAEGDITGQFLGVSAADSGNADQPRAIIGDWNIGEDRRVVVSTLTNADGITPTYGPQQREVPDPNNDELTTLEDLNGSTLMGVYGADLVVP